ncbi:MAG: hypothetical protein ABSG53_26625 [Thermoguttaceae bacterium]|jgi:hypothetical protein
MKASSLLQLVILIVASLAALLPARAGEFLYRGRQAQWNTNYYDPAWGMPEALVVPPRVRWQSNYAWGVGGSRVDRIGARYQAEVPGPESAYNQRDYRPAPPQPTDTQQFGVNYVRGPRR